MVHFVESCGVNIERLLRDDGRAAGMFRKPSGDIKHLAIHDDQHLTIGITPDNLKIVNPFSPDTLLKLPSTLTTQVAQWLASKHISCLLQLRQILKIEDKVVTIA